MSRHIHTREQITMTDYKKRDALATGLNLDQARKVAETSMGKSIDADMLKSALEASGWEDRPSPFFKEDLRVDQDAMDGEIRLPA